MKRTVSKLARYPYQKGMKFNRTKVVADAVGQSPSTFRRKQRAGEAPYFQEIGPMMVALPDYVLEDFIKSMAEGKPFDAEAYIREIGGEIIEP